MFSTHAHAHTVPHMTRDILIVFPFENKKKRLFLLKLVGYFSNRNEQLNK